MNNKIDNKKYIKIPAFFKNNGKLFHKIGGRYAFGVYCMLISRQNILKEVHTSISEILHYIELGKNKSREGKKIKIYLKNLKSNKLIDFDFNIDSLNNDTFFKITCVDIESADDYKDLIIFYEDDFVLYNIIGIIPYCVMWILRMLQDRDTKMAGISITDMSKILLCKNDMVNKAIQLFKYVNLFKVTSRHSYYDGNYNKKDSDTNEYEYIGDLNVLLSLDLGEVEEILTNGLYSVNYNQKIDVRQEGESCINKHGIYCIYDYKGDMGYIGKSLNCIVKRSLKSVEERNLYNFTRIELKPTCVKSDIDIYEKYYIQKYKPYCNLEGVYKDSSTIRLPELKTKQTLYNKQVDNQ